jgi:hypothetical protein
MKSHRVSTSFRGAGPCPARNSLHARERSLLAAASLGALLSACSDNATTTVQPPADASMTVDSGSTPMDSGSAPMDSGSTPMDSGSAPMDSGSAPVDSGSAPNPVVPACPAEAGATLLSFTNHTYADDPRFFLRKDEAIFSGINTLDDPYLQRMRLHNGGTASVTITSLGIATPPQTSLMPASFRQHANATAFKATVVAASDAGADAAATAQTLPATIAAGGDLDVEVQFLSTNTMPPSRFDNTGGEAVAALLVAQTSTDCVQAGLYGVALWNNPESLNDAGVPSGNYGRYEPTLGQIIATLGYQVNVGDNLKTYLNVNQVTPFSMATPPAGDGPSDEVLIHDFVLADPSKPAVLLAPGRFAPKIDFPFGWFASGSVTMATAQPAALMATQVPGPADFPAGLQYVAAMSSVLGSDPYTSDHSEMVFPPINGNTAGTFTPTGSFGLWCFGAQRSDGSISLAKVTNAAPLNGDYDYSYDELNIVTQTANPPLPADIVEAGVNFGVASPVHRYRIWPLKDRAGTPVANSYLIALEEATNDDYQDMIFTISNVKPAPPSDGGTVVTGTDAGDAGAADAKAD